MIFLWYSYIDGWLCASKIIVLSKFTRLLFRCELTNRFPNFPYVTEQSRKNEVGVPCIWWLYLNDDYIGVDLQNNTSYEKTDKIRLPQIHYLIIRFIKNQLQCVRLRKLTFELYSHIPCIITLITKIHFNIDDAIKIKPQTKHLHW